MSAIDIMGYVFTISDTCTNDDTSGDSYGDTCTEYYDNYPGGCGYYESSTFNSTSQCCACGGGTDNSTRRQLWGGLAEVAEPQLETEVTPVGSHEHAYYSSYSYSY